MSLEDDFCDIIKKARMGQGKSLKEVAERADVSESTLQSLEKGSQLPTARQVEGIANAVSLRSPSLVQIAVENWGPQPPPSWADDQEPVMTVLGDIGGYEVKGYVLYDVSSREAVLIDTAYNASVMLAMLKKLDLQLVGVCLTHGHTDHAGGLDRILEEWPVPVYLGDGDWNLLSWKPAQHLLKAPTDGQMIGVGRLTVKCLATPGHTPGGFCYQVEDADGDLCFAGDTLFAGSIGRSNPFSLYPTHLKSVRQTVLNLPESTVLLPGHGPATTVREELTHNPFG